jgi:phosphoglycolate phosphatase-like HAD superfamily hydrolase
MKSLAFDLDGTLISAESKQAGLLKAVCARYGIALDLRKIWPLKRNGLSNLRLLLDLGVENDLARQIARAWQQEIESPYWLMLDVPMVDAVATLLRVRAADYQSVIVTARNNRSLLQQQLVRTALLSHVDRVFCVPTNDSASAKADVLASLGPMALFGDTEVDHAAAQLAGVPFYAVSTGLRSGDFLRANGASTVSASLGAAVDLFAAASAGPALPK